MRPLLEGLEGQVALYTATAGEPPTHTSRPPTSVSCRCDPRARTSPCVASTHVEQLGPPIAELARVLRPGGTLVTTDMHPVAVAMGGQAYFTAGDGSRLMARNHVHWPSMYADSFHTAGLAIDRLEELFVEQSYLEQMATPEIREAARSLLGLPLVSAWRVRKLPG